MFYSVERVQWCIRRGREVLFRLTYRREWIEHLKTWADYLVFAEELN